MREEIRVAEQRRERSGEGARKGGKWISSGAANLAGIWKTRMRMRMRMRNAERAIALAWKASLGSLRWSTAGLDRHDRAQEERRRLQRPTRRRLRSRSGFCIRPGPVPMYLWYDWDTVCTARDGRCPPLACVIHSCLFAAPAVVTASPRLVVSLTCSACEPPHHHITTLAYHQIIRPGYGLPTCRDPCAPASAGGVGPRSQTPSSSFRPQQPKR